MKIVASILLAVGPALAAGCMHGPRSVADPDPADKIPAIQKAAREHDPRAIPQLVADLESNDPAIRFYAIDALRMMVGEDFGYEYFLDDDARKPAVERWKAWLARQAR